MIRTKKAISYLFFIFSFFIFSLREDSISEEDIVSLNQKAADFWKSREWICFNEQGKADCGAENLKFRFMAIKSEHAPRFAGIKLYSGTVESTEGNAPIKGSDWKEGQTFAYLMDFLGPNKTVDLRIHFQDAASNPPAGFIPLLEEKDTAARVDIAIVCAAAFSQVKNYPEGIIFNTKPRYVILSHWENFFEPLPSSKDQLNVVPGTDLDKLIQRLEASLPKPE